MRRSLDLFAAGDGTLYLMHAGLEDMEIRDVSAADRALLSALTREFATAPELEQEISGAGLNASGVETGLLALEDAGLLEREAGELSSNTRERYDRQLIYFADLGGPAEEMQRRLHEATVLVLGCGGLGSWTTSALACAGVGNLILVDDDSVEISNLNRQLLFSESDLGRSKVEAAAAALASNNSALVVTPLRQQIRSAANLTSLLGGVALVICTADWPAYELPRWVNEACLAAHIPFITAGQFPPLVRVGPMTLPGTSACFECWEAGLRREHPLYGEATTQLDQRTSTAATIGAASGLVGSMLAMEAIHFLIGAKPATVGAAHVFDLRTFTSTRTDIPRDESCKACSNLPATAA